MVDRGDMGCRYSYHLSVPTPAHDSHQPSLGDNKKKKTKNYITQGCEIYLVPGNRPRQAAMEATLFGLEDVFLGGQGVLWNLTTAALRRCRILHLRTLLTLRARRVPRAVYQVRIRLPSLVAGSRRSREVFSLF